MQVTALRTAVVWCPGASSRVELGLRSDIVNLKYYDAALAVVCICLTCDQCCDEFGNVDFCVAWV